jgi:hypothetical protein
MRVLRILFGGSVLISVTVAGKFKFRMRAMNQSSCCTNDVRICFSFLPALADTSAPSEDEPSSTKITTIHDDASQPPDANATKARKTRTKKTSTQPTDEQHTRAGPQNVSLASAETAATTRSPADENSTLATGTATKSRNKTSLAKKSNHTRHDTFKTETKFKSSSTYKQFVYRITTPKLFDTLHKASPKIKDSELKERKKHKKGEPARRKVVEEEEEDDSGEEDDDSIDYAEYEDNDESETSSGSVDDEEKPPKLKKPKKTKQEKKRMMKKQKKKERKRNQMERLQSLALNSSDSGERRRALEKLQRKEERKKAWLERMNGTEGYVNTSSVPKPERPRKKEKLPDFVEGKGWIDDAGDLQKFLDKTAPETDEEEEEEEEDQPKSRRSRARERDARNGREQGFGNDKGGNRGSGNRPSYGGNDRFGRRNDRFDRGNDRGYDRNDRYGGSRFGSNDRRDNRYERNDRGGFDRRDDRDNRYGRYDRDRRGDDRRTDRFQDNRYGSERRSDSWRGSGAGASQSRWHRRRRRECRQCRS